jgi:hypothetical protein
MERRELLIGALGASAYPFFNANNALGAPTPLALAEEIEDQSILAKNTITIINYFLNYEGAMAESIKLNNVRINLRALIKYPDVFNKEFPTSPVGFDPIDGKILVVKTFGLKSFYTMEQILDIKTMHGLNAAKEAIDLFVDKAIEEVIKLYKDEETCGLRVYPYIPLETVQAIDQETYQPKIGMKTRFATSAVEG